ncbi:MAG: hypothetical protein LBV28_02230, partial [Puniceicoccales bacterium]|nr:hypothetical protein [Puniceicoccales bacterium]
MKTHTLGLAFSAVASLFTIALPAAPLREADIAERAAWFAHADFDAFRASPAAKQLRDAYSREAPLLAKLEAQTGFIAREHITGITAYGAGEKAQGAVLIRHKFSNEKLAAWLAQSGKAAPVGAALATGTPVTRFELPVQHFHGGNASAGSAPEKKILADFSVSGVLVLATDAVRLDAALARLSAVEPVVVVPEIYRELKT